MTSKSGPSSKARTVERGLFVAWGVARIIGSSLGLAGVFVAALVLGVAVHMDVPVFRRMVAAQLSTLASSAFAGSVEIERVAGVDVRGIEGASVRVFDPYGHQVVYADGVTVRVRTIQLVRSLRRSGGPIVVPIRTVRVHHADVSFDTTTSGKLRLESAFASERAEVEAPGAGREVIVDASDIALEHAWLHGTPPSGPRLDVEVSNVQAALRVEPDATWSRLDRARVVVRGMPYALDPRGAIRGEWTIPGGEGLPLIARLAFDGEIGGLRATAGVRMHGRRVSAHLDASLPAGAHAGALLGERAVLEPMTMRVDADGELPKVEARLTLTFGAASVGAFVVAELEDRWRATVLASARGIDLARMTPGAPRTELGFDAKVSVVAGRGPLHGQLSINVLEGRIGPTYSPPIEVRGRIDRGEAFVTARVQSETMPTELTLDVSPKRGEGEAWNVDVAVRSRISNLALVPMLHDVEGRADVRSSARLVFPERRLEESRIVVVARDLSAGGVASNAVHLRARGLGSLEKPTFEVDLRALQVTRNDLSLASLDARGRVEPDSGGVSFIDANVDASRSSSERVSFRARRIRIAREEIAIETGEIVGLGDPLRFDGAKRGRDLRFEVAAPRVDVSRVARFAGAPTLVAAQSSFALHAEGALERGHARGAAHLVMDGAFGESLGRGRASLDASIDDRRLHVRLNAKVEPAGHLTIVTEELELDGRADDPESWRRLRGSVYGSSDLDLDAVASILPARALPFAELHGRLAVRGSVTRRRGAPPSFALHARTNGLVLAGRTSAPEVINGIQFEAPPRWRTANVDFAFDARGDGWSGLTTFSARAVDRLGMVASLDAKAILPYAELADDPARTERLLLRAPLNAKLVVPPRPFGELPAILAQKDVSGVVSADVDATGTILAPRVHAVLNGRRVRVPNVPNRFVSDANVTVDYDGRDADVVATVSARGGELLGAALRVELDVRELVRVKRRPSDRRPVRWTASGRVRLDDFPLESLPLFADRRVAGRAHGELFIGGIHRDARARARLDLRDFAIGDVAYRRAGVSVDVGGGEVAADLRVDQDEGFVQARATARVAWGDSLLPALVEGAHIDGRLTARSLRASAIQPFVADLFPVLDGKIDANVRTSVSPLGRSPTLEGDVRLDDGVIQIAVLGEELSDVTAQATFTPDGIVRVTEASAQGRQGRISAEASIRLDGLRFDDAVANIQVPSRRPFFVAIQGLPVGEMSGAIALKASLSPDGENMEVVVDVRKLTIELPRVTKTGLQSLDRKSNVRVGTYVAQGRFVRLPLSEDDLSDRDARGGKNVEFDVRLGETTVSRENQLWVLLAGNPTMSVDDGEMKPAGQVHIERGWLDVRGKRFEIERGTVTFDGRSPSDPTVVASAVWTSVDGTRVYADFVGPAQTGKVTLRSEPPRPQNEILALVIFGTADGVNPQSLPSARQPDGTTRAAVGLGGGLVAQGLTEALDDLTGVHATARVDTTRANNPRPEVEFQLTPEVAIAFAHVIGTPPITEPDKNFARFEYRFHRNWSLQTMVGDRGTALVDAVWQRRY